MKKQKYDPAAVRSVMSALDAAATKHPIRLVRYASTKWSQAQQKKAALLRQRKILERELAKVSEQLTR